MGRILIKNGRVWDGENFIFADILTEGKKIQKISESIAENADYTFDAKGLIVSPGLVDLHVHSKGISSDEFGINAEASSFPFGVTAVNNAGTAFANKVISDTCAVKNTVFVGVGVKNGHAVLESTNLHLKEYGEKAVGIKVYLDTELSPLTDGTLLKEVCSFARENNLSVMVHCSNSPISMAEIVRILSKGDIVTHVFHGGMNSCTENDFEAFRLAKEKGVIMDSGFAGFVHTNFANLKSCIDSGFLPDTISTDITRFSAFKRGGRYGMTMCMSIARLLEMHEEDIFKAVTSNPAKVLNRGKEWGYLREGRYADISVFDFTSEGFELTDKEGNKIKSSEGYRCVLTLSDGEIVYKDR